MALIFAERQGEPPVSRKGLQQLFRDPLSLLSHWYNARLSPEDQQALNTTTNHEEIALDALPGNQTTPPRLHEGAEAFKSSLKAGTASIVITDERGTLNYLDLPVSY